MILSFFCFLFFLNNEMCFMCVAYMVHVWMRALWWVLFHFTDIFLLSFWVLLFEQFGAVREKFEEIEIRAKLSQKNVERKFKKCFLICQRSTRRSKNDSTQNRKHLEGRKCFRIGPSVARKHKKFFWVWLGEAERIKTIQRWNGNNWKTKNASELVKV